MGDSPNIDPRMQAALARLTENEKECLRRRLQQQTAKEMALELGVSPHAVEKRLKMARTKLGLSSSLEAARLLVASEGYQQTGPYAPDLDRAREPGDRWFHRPLTLGVIAMSILATVLLAVAMQGQGKATRQVDTSVYDEMADGRESEPRDISELQFVKASPERVRAYVRQMFDTLDADASGFVELLEAPAHLSIGKSSQAGGSGTESAEAAEVLEGDAARRRYIANVDTDGDEKVSFEEYAIPVMPQFLERGIPLLPADWKPVGNRRDGDG